MAKLVNKAQANLTVPKEMIENLVQEYNFISSQIKKLDERKKNLAGMIKNYAIQHGTKDDKGSYYCENDNFVYGVVAKFQTVQRKDIIPVLKEMGRDDCIDVVEVVNVDKINKYHNEGVFTDDDVMRLFEVKTLTPSVSVKEKKELSEVEKRAASRKR